MIAATAIVLMLVVSLYASLRTAFKARSTATAAVEMVRKGNMAMEVIKADLRSAVVPTGVLAGEFVGTGNSGMFDTGAAELSFHSSAVDIEAAPGVGDIKKIEYRCEDGSLIRAVTTNLLASATPEPRTETLCRGVAGFTLRYFDGSAWVEEWASADLDNRLPLAVEVTLELDDDAGQDPRRLTQIVMIPCGNDVSVTNTSAATGGTGGGR